MQTGNKQSATTAEQESYWQNIKVQTRKYLYPDINEEQFDTCFQITKALNLNPLNKEVFYLPFKSKYVVYIANEGRRILAVRTGEYEGETQAFWCGLDGVWTDVWLSDTPPAAAKIGVYRKGFREALWHTALFKNCKKNTEKWRDTPDYMLLMRAESGALKRAFPEHIPDSPFDEADEADEIPNAGRFENAQRAAEAPKKAPQSTAFTTSTNVAEPQNYRGKLLQLIYNQIEHLVATESGVPAENHDEVLALMADTQKLYDCVLNVDLPEADFKKTLDYFETNGGVNRKTLNRVLPPLQAKLAKSGFDSYQKSLLAHLYANLTLIDERNVDERDISFVSDIKGLINTLIERVSTVDLPEAAFETEYNQFKKYGVNKNTLNLALSRLIKK